MAYWLLKTEAETFSWDDQVKRGAKGEPWTGVRNFTARGYLKDMKKGESRLLLSHWRREAGGRHRGGHQGGLHRPERREGRVQGGRRESGKAGSQAG